LGRRDDLDDVIQNRMSHRKKDHDPKIKEIIETILTGALDGSDPTDRFAPR